MSSLGDSASTYVPRSGQ